MLDPDVLDRAGGGGEIDRVGKPVLGTGRRVRQRRVYVNYLEDEGAERVRAAYGPNYDRLVALKNKYDPTNFFHINQNIRPTV